MLHVVARRPHAVQSGGWKPPLGFRQAALLLAVVVAENLDAVLLPLPAMQLIEELAALSLGDLRLGRALRQRAEGVEAGEFGVGDCGLRIFVLCFHE